MAIKTVPPTTAALGRALPTGKQAKAEPHANSQPPRTQEEAEAQIKSLIERHKPVLDALAKL